MCVPFLVGAFPLSDCFFSRRFSREKCPTLTVASFFSFFFVRLQSHSDWATFLTIETTKTTSIRGQVRSAEISAKGSPLSLFIFLRNLQNRKRPKGPPFQFFSALCEIFFENFLRSQRSPPFEFFDILQQNVC